MILALNVHYSRASDIIIPDYLTTDPRFRLEDIATASATGVPGLWRRRAHSNQNRFAHPRHWPPGPILPDAWQHAVRICRKKPWCSCWEAAIAKRICCPRPLGTLRALQPGWARVQSICDYVHNRIVFDYQKARATRTAWEAFNEGTGVCRDYATWRSHFAVPEYSSALLHRLSGRYGDAAALWCRGFCRLV